MRKKIFWTAMVIIACIAAWGYFLYHKPRADLSSVKASASIDAADLYNQYQQNEASANTLFLGKVIEVKGIVADIQQTDSSLSIGLKVSDGGGINCSIASHISNKIATPQ